MALSASPPATTSKADPNPAIAPLRVDTDLTVTVNGVSADLESTGRRIIVQFQSLSDLVRALKGDEPSVRRSLLNLLETTDLTVEIRARDRILAVVGGDARPGLISNRMGWDRTEIRLGGFIGAAAAGATAVWRTLARLGS